MRLPRLLPNLPVLIVLAGMLVGCEKSGSGPSGPPIAQARGKGMPVPVTVATVTQKDVPLELRAIGTARALACISVKARVDGELARVAFKQGDEVRKGDLIFEIDPRPFQALLNQTEAMLARDLASLTNAEADMRRTDELAGTKAVPATVLDANRAKVATLRSSVAADRATIESARLQLSFCSIASPINGRMGMRLVDEGNMVKNNDTILAVVNQTRPIYVDFSVPERFLTEVRETAPGTRLKVQASAPQHPDARAAGEVEVVNNQVDTTTGTLLLRAKFANEDERLWPGQFLNVTLTFGQLTNATVVPTQTVQASQNGDFVFVVKPDTSVEKRMVTLGPVRGDETVVRSGVKVGETVVTDGQLRLGPGAKVSVQSPDRPASSKPEAEKPA